MASALTPLAAQAVAFVRGLTAKLYKASGEEKNLCEEARACGIRAPSSYSHCTSTFTYIVAVTAADGELAALLGVNEDAGELYLEFETFTCWDDKEEVDHLVKTTLTIDIDPALMAAAIAVLPRGIGTINVEDDEFEKLSISQWMALCTAVVDTHASKTITL